MSEEQGLREKLREAFQRKRYGAGDSYDPDFDLFDVAADALCEQWRPIETAPKDGTWVLVWDIQSEYQDPKWESNPHIAAWRDGRFRIQVDGQSTYPTHWMSLPFPPSAG